jgi:hypothetical protein
MVAQDPKAKYTLALTYRVRQPSISDPNRSPRMSRTAPFHFNRPLRRVASASEPPRAGR